MQVSLPHKIGSSPNNSKNLIRDNAKMTGNYWSPAVICSPVNDISRMQNFLPAGKKIIIFKSFIESQFKYWTLTWMFCSQKGNNIINSLHERYLRTVNNDYESTYEELLSHNNYFSIHDQNIYCLSNEIYKSANDLSVGDFKNLFDLKISIPYISFSLILNWKVKILLMP